MKDDTLTGGRLWSGKEQARSHAQPGARRDDKVVPLIIPDRSYVAFEIKDNPKRLHIRTALNGSFYPSYHYLRDIHFGHDLESIFTLIYTFMTVEVTGEHLAPIVHAIDAEDCKRIIEFHPTIHDHPGRGVPFIQQVRILSDEGKPVGPLPNPNSSH
jgi:hypothetical protein